MSRGFYNHIWYKLLNEEGIPIPSASVFIYWYRNPVTELNLFDENEVLLTQPILTDSEGILEFYVKDHIKSPTQGYTWDTQYLISWSKDDKGGVIRGDHLWGNFDSANVSATDGTLNKAISNFLGWTINNHADFLFGSTERCGSSSSSSSSVSSSSESSSSSSSSSSTSSSSTSSSSSSSTTPVNNYLLPAYGTITSSDVTNPSNIYDDDYMDTYGDIDNSPLGYIQIQLDTPIAINKMTAKGDNTGLYVSRFQLLASNTGLFSGEEVTLLDEIGSAYVITSNFGTWEFDNTIPYEYYRITPGGSIQPWRCCIIELYNQKSNPFALDMFFGNSDRPNIFYPDIYAQLDQDNLGDHWITRVKKGRNTGKWYFEILLLRKTNLEGPMIGWISQNHDDRYEIGADGTQVGVGWWYNGSTGRYYSDGTYTSAPSAVQPTTGDYLMSAIDCVTGEVWFGVNGVWNDGGDPEIGTNPAVTETEFIGISAFAAATLRGYGGAISSRDRIKIAVTSTEISGSIPAGFNALDGT